jgi:diguanylate cyclase (GGDEF)-like protein
MVKDHHVRYYRHAAATDFLTGLLNRRAFLESALRLCAEKSNRPITLLIFDLDHFKSINDKYGHLVGDEVLRVFARVARRSTRATDIIGRIGGEEFAAIVDEPMELALPIAERIRAGFQISGAQVMDKPVGATVSIGAATSHELVTNIDALIAQADAALYRAKGAGRNRLRTADAEPEKEQARLIVGGRGRTSKLRRMLRRGSAA